MSGWVAALGPSNGVWALNRTGGIYTGILQQKDIRSNAPDSRWRTIGKITGTGWVNGSWMMSSIAAG